jgi:hypothetical protein
VVLGRLGETSHTGTRCWNASRVSQTKPGSHGKHAGHSPEPRHSTSVPRTEVLWRGSAAATEVSADRRGRYCSDSTENRREPSADR